MSSKSERSHLTPWLFVLPALAVYGLFVLWPVIDTVRMSLLRWPSAGADPVVAGLGNYAKLFGDRIFWSAAMHNGLLMIMSLIVQLPIAFLLAYMLSGNRVLGRGLFRTTFFVPMIMPTTAIAVLWGFVFLPEMGLLDSAIRVCNPDFAHGWLSDPKTAMLSVFCVVCWRYVGFHMVLFMAGMSAIPESSFEAAQIDGANDRQLVRYVVIPQLRGTILVCALLSVLGSLKYFDLVYMLVGGAPAESREVLATRIFRLAFESGQGRFGYASSIAVVFLIITMVAGLFANRLRRRRES